MTEHAPEAPSHEPPRGRRWIVALGVLATVSLLAILIEIPYHSIGPGPVRNMAARIEVRGAETFPSEGKLLLLTASVSTDTLSLAEALWTFIDRDLSLIKRERLIPAGVSPAEQEAENAAAMEDSKTQAEVAVFRALGCDIEALPGLRVNAVVRGSPADGELKRGDVILAVDGRRIGLDAQRLTRVISRKEIGDRVRFTVRRNDRVRTIRTDTVEHPRNPGRPAVGIHLGTLYRLPARADISTARVAGPSGGLVFALALADVLVPDDLTRGRTIAVTGTIAIDGSVGPVGAISEKMIAARRAGATLIVVPAAEAGEARSAAGDGVRVAGVETLSEALRVIAGKRAERIEPGVCPAR